MRCSFSIPSGPHASGYKLVLVNRRVTVVPGSDALVQFLMQVMARYSYIWWHVGSPEVVRDILVCDPGVPLWLTSIHFVHGMSAFPIFIIDDVRLLP